MTADSSPEHIELRRKFRIFYQEELKAFFAPMETERRKYLNRFWLLLIITLLAVPAIIVFSLMFYISIERVPNRDETGFFLMLIVVFIGICSAPILSYKKRIKGSVMEKMISFFGDFFYLHENRLSWDILEQSKLFSKPTFQAGDDYFYGKYKGVGITISEEKHEVKTGKNTHTVFRGIIILLDMDKPFTGKTIVKKDCGWMINKCKSFGAGLGKKVALEDVTFEKHFEAYSDDQIESRFLLTTAFMERILKVKEVFKGKSIEFSFFDNKLLIKIPTRKDMFEASSLFSSATDYNRIEGAFDQFCSVFSIVDILKLNRRIN